MPSQNYDIKTLSGGFRIWDLTKPGTPPSVNHASDGYLARDKRVRSWLTQQKPYIKTLGYDDLRTDVLHCGPFDLVWWDRVNSSQPWRALRRREGYPYIGVDAVNYVESHDSIGTSAAKQRCLESAGEVKWNLPLFVAEANQTIDMIHGTASFIADGFKLFKKKKFRKLMKHFKLTKKEGHKSSWMSYRYGWTPLLGDVASAAEAAASVLYHKPEVKRIKCRGPHVEAVSHETLAASDTRYTFGTGIQSSKRKVSYYSQSDTKAWLTLSVRSKTLMRLEQFGIANPLALAWELVPMSFVADWFVGIGDYLSSQTALLGLTVLDGGTSYVSERILRSERMYSTATSIAKETGLNPAYSVRSRKYKRTYWDGSPPPLRVDINLNWKRLLDASALLDNVFGRRN